MIILASMQSILGVVMKYVSLAVIVRIPKFYFESLKEHKIQQVAYTLDIT